MTEPEKMTRGLLHAAARARGIRLDRIVTSTRVTGRALRLASDDAIARVAEYPDRDGCGRFRSYGYATDGRPYLDRDASATPNEPVTIIVTVYQAADQFGPTACPTCGAALIWGAGPSCPNECPEVEQ